MFFIKRKFGRNHDWLMAWDEQWGTSCIGSRSKAMSFTTRDEADTACARANATCIGFQGAPMPEGMHFVVFEENPSIDKLVIVDPLDDADCISLVLDNREAMIQEAHLHIFVG